MPIYNLLCIYIYFRYLSLTLVDLSTYQLIDLSVSCMYLKTGLGSKCTHSSSQKTLHHPCASIPGTGSFSMVLRRFACVQQHACRKWSGYSLNISFDKQDKKSEKKRIEKWN